MAEITTGVAEIGMVLSNMRGDLECVFYGYHLDRAILKIAESAYCVMPSLGRDAVLAEISLRSTSKLFIDIIKKMYL